MSKPLERTSEAVDHDVAHILELQGSRRAARRDASSEVEAGVDDLNFLQNFLLHCLIDNVRRAVCSRLSQDGLDAVYDTVTVAQMIHQDSLPGRREGSTCFLSCITRKDMCPGGNGPHTGPLEDGTCTSILDAETHPRGRLPAIEYGFLGPPNWIEET